jgi:tRNA/tmRNA/rRNA uracil-C5-methylase (TrmA/RlmC/RlmD family)
VTTLAIDGAGLEDMSIRTGPFAFAQAQAAQNAALVAEVLDAAGRGYRRGLELYAGSGNF